MALGPGSIAFTGFNGDGPDNLAFVALEAIAAGTVIQFTDNEWDGASFNTGESAWSWTAASDIAAGAVVTMDGLANGQTATSNLGTIAFSDDTDRNIFISNEIVYAYIGAPGAPTAFLAAIANDRFAVGGASLDGTGLTAGVTAISLSFTFPHADIAAYNGPASNLPTFADYLQHLNNPANWITQGDGSGQNNDGTAPDAPFGTAPFTIDPTAQLFGFASASTSAEEGDSGTRTFTFTVQRTGNTAGNLTFSGSIALGTADASDFGGVAPTTFNGVIPDGDTSATFTIEVTGDTVLESNHDFFLKLTSASAPGANVMITTDSATATILDDESVVIAAGETRDTLVTLDGAQSLIIEDGGTLENSVEVGNLPLGVVIDNAGAILPEISAGGIGQAGDLPTGGNITIINRETGVIRADGGSGAIQFSNQQVDGDNSKFVLDNAGLLENTSGVVVRLTDLRFDSIEIHNRETGQIINHTPGADVFRAAEGIVFDGVTYVGVPTIVKIYNDGIIKHGPDTEFEQGGDAIDFSSGGGTVVNSATGLIEGSRHGITGNRPSIVENSGTIIGRNGSAVNIDNDSDESQRVYVVNHGSLQGRSQNLDDSDGDAIDTDGLATVDNYGTIEGLGHNGYHSGEPNISEGLAIGGGTINNYAGATIYGFGRAIQVDDSENGDAFSATRIYNEGLIKGDGNDPTGVEPEDAIALAVTGNEAVNLVGDWNDTIINKGTIIGGIKMGGGDDLLDNTSRIIGPIDLGNGNDTYRGRATSNVSGPVNGGAGNDGLFGGDANDKLNGGADNDLLRGNVGNDSLDGGTGNDSLDGGAGTDELTGGDGDDKLLGGLEGDTLLGGFGNDKLDGGTGADLMMGEAGNDLYFVDDVNDQAIEMTGQGTDRVMATISYTLGANLESLTLTGGAAIDGTGNGLNNTITGNQAANTLHGGGGNDVLNGGAGADDLAGGDGNDNLLGGTDDDTLQGGSGNDKLDGGTGADLMKGEAGDDLYVVDDVNDQAIEIAGGGTDRVMASIDYTLGANLENLSLTAGAALDGTGNDLNNTIAGNEAANVLSGIGGNDVLNGGAGSDALLGGIGNDSLNGGTENDLLIGSAGNDVMTGGNGTDVFGLRPGFGADKIIDFSDADFIDLRGFGYASGQAVVNSFIQVGASVILGLATGDQLTLQNVQKADLDASQFIVTDAGTADVPADVHALMDQYLV